MGSRIPKVAGSGRKGENYATMCNILQSKCKEVGANKYRVGTGIKRYRKREL